ncbi:hypothetical protein [Sphingomonas sp.]|uniref:hypothetical protein n=1 Tax=Sphingomonas sp. TaxID=28214 RepID=UPI0035B1791B
MTDETADLSADAERAARLEARVAELETALRTAAVAGELRTEAVRAGMIDLDGLKLADTGSVTLDESGRVEGAAAVVAALRRDKPWLFGPASSSSAATPPPMQPARARLATEMTYAEWQAARRELLRRR